MRCKYIRKIFQNEENGYTVALFSTLDHEVPLSARDKFWADKKIIAFTAKGYDLPLTDEIEIEMEGEFLTDFIRIIKSQILSEKGLIEWILFFQCRKKPTQGA